MDFAWKYSIALLLGLGASIASAQSNAPTAAYPARAVRLIVPFPPGGATDVIARLVGQKLAEAWSQPVVIDNRAGATGAIGSELVARAAPDGYTLLMGTASTHSVAPAVNARLPYNNLTDYVPVSLVATFPNMLVVHPSVPAKSVPEFIALLKANPGKYNFASSGPGSSIHLAGELFKLMSGTAMTHIPYKGSAPALNDLLAGQIHCIFDNMTTVWPHVQTGRLRALGVAGRERSPVAPDVPAIAETLPGFEANSWVGLFAPAGTARDIVQKISRDAHRAIAVREIAQRLRELGAAGVGSAPEDVEGLVTKQTVCRRLGVEMARIVLE